MRLAQSNTIQFQSHHLSLFLPFSPLHHQHNHTQPKKKPHDSRQNITTHTKPQRKAMPIPRPRPLFVRHRHRTTQLHTPTTLERRKVIHQAAECRFRLSRGVRFEGVFLCGGIGGPGVVYDVFALSQSLFDSHFHFHIFISF
ncbi:hypothetical protein P280DRAFT_320732 [Massarina eburnea CBS 473.64]|uniref:Uncharacterized protein n=1 Tax=Massarina eburnea CBS 473.64 TaxID=1395130 RepID=A0A6A6RY89_9PLEO|nr:hypothetical protein P280DRAFT_320732 [Massarina eburnea CBS 473.64]